MNTPKLARLLPAWKNAALALLSAILLILAFPDFGFWFLAWVAVIPLLLAVAWEAESAAKSFLLGWLWGFVFFSGTCWWLTYAPITYAGFPTVVAYLLLFCVTTIVGIFPGIFAMVLSILIRRYGSSAILASPFVWVFSEFLRYWITGNNWNAIGYSQAFVRPDYASIGGVLLVSSSVVLMNLLMFGAGFMLWSWGRQILFAAGLLAARQKVEFVTGDGEASRGKLSVPTVVFIVLVVAHSLLYLLVPSRSAVAAGPDVATVVAVQPNVPMSGLTYEKWKQLRAEHVQLAESALATVGQRRAKNTTVIFPESPMNFAYEEDEEFRTFVHAFAAKNNVNVLFNSAEPDPANNKYFNSAVMVNTDGKEIAQYDKIYLLPFGEAVPSPLQAIVPAFVGSFSYGKEYDLFPVGDAKAGVMICFESHFGELGREYVRNGADVLIEMTNDGYLGPTPVLKQHLANAVFRAVETNRPMLRVTNVGITAYIDEHGSVHDPAESYTDATRVWSVSRSDGSQTFYVKYGDWFAFLCSIVTLVALILAITKSGGKGNAKTVET